MNETRVKEALNLVFHGLKTGQRQQMFAEVREWLDELDPAIYAFGAERCRSSVSAIPLIQCALQEGHAGEHRAHSGDLRLTDFDVDKMTERLAIECDLREMAAEANDGPDLSEWRTR